MRMTDEFAGRLARLTLDGLHREYPHGEVLVVSGLEGLGSPRELHPAFYGCFDWHSAVHGHWSLVRLLKKREIAGAREAMRETLTAENILAEVRFMKEPGREGFERTYGWAWVLKLAQELSNWDDSDGAGWRVSLQPLVDLIVSRYRDFLPRQAFPIRGGTHTNTAFGLAFAHDFALAVADESLLSLVEKRSRDYFGADRDYPARFEPSGADFLSPCLCEADLMRRVLPPGEFAAWLSALLPTGLPAILRTPVSVSDRSDGQIGHLDGLCLSRGWALTSVEKCLPINHPLRPQFGEAANAHVREVLNHVFTGDYAGEHWLASYAVYLLSVLDEA